MAGRCRGSPRRASWSSLSPAGLRTPAAASQAPSGCTSPIFLVSINSGQDLQIYKSVNGLYSPISHFNNTRPCLQSVDSFSLAPKPGAVGWGRERGAGRVRGPASPPHTHRPGFPGFARCACRGFTPAPCQRGWRASTASHALSRNSRHGGPRCIR